MSRRYAVGIDLGTTHSALAVVDLEGAGARPSPMPIPQLVARGVVEPRALLASFLYLPHESEQPEPLPWDHERAFAVGEYARARGVETPARVIASAKSWLSHPSVDRRAGNLPLGAPDDVEKISPVEASWRYLEHLGEAFSAAHDGASLDAQHVVLTVPASFDAGARDLTVEAALAAGIDDLTLLEEPQAALYAWIEQRGEDWRRELTVGDVLLVIDVGGGTTDFSAIEVREQAGSLELCRIAVGDHILLGGDNMDLALAHLLKAKIEAAGDVKLDRWQMTALTYAARSAKERILGDDAVDSAPVVLPGRGSQLIANTLRADLTRDEVTMAILDGFFPVVGPAERPVTRARVGLTQLGLPYASDPAVTKHLAAFLGRQANAIAKDGPRTGTAADRRGKILHPTAILFNGGVTKSQAIQGRITEVLTAWLADDGQPAPRVLDAPDLDLAVARGAAYYGLVRRGKGLRIRGGTARAYYIGIESAVPAVPGVEPPIDALCVAPFGMEEGTEAALPPQELGLVVGEPVRFRFFGSTVRRDDTAGTLLEAWDDEELEELAPIEITMAAEGRREGDVVPVRLASSISPVGTLQIDAVPIHALVPDERWRVELSVRAPQE